MLVFHPSMTLNTLMDSNFGRQPLTTKLLFYPIPFTMTARINSSPYLQTSQLWRFVKCTWLTEQALLPWGHILISLSMYMFKGSYQGFASHQKLISNFICSSNFVKVCAKSNFKRLDQKFSIYMGNFGPSFCTQQMFWMKHCRLQNSN